MSPKLRLAVSLAVTLVPLSAAPALPARACAFDGGAAAGSSPIRFIAADSSSLTASPSRSRNDPSIPASARSRQRSSRYGGTPVHAIGFLLIHLAANEAPLRVCAQRSSVAPAPGLRLARPVLWKAWTGCARPRFPQGQQKLSVSVDNVVSKETGASSFGTVLVLAIV